ncbi:condensation domain-containing protein [Allorhizocola rhizosphaerae]|uniref:condensation domain-containing protein n=1 Tax=Allorhizocola rhizosphaerae TaxID=1872709 RepID=UPI0013C2E837|nr:condensation domain-containing protein [Allorhizocola rhizosphaerae]
MISERVPVPFEGVGSGVGELSWTQQAMWADMKRAGISLAMTAVRELAPGATAAEFADEYRFYLSRYESMRTLLRFEPDGRVLQVVHGSGTAEIKIIEAGDRDPAELAVELADNYGFMRFDYERDWPMQLMLVRRDGVLTHAVIAVAHHMADFNAAMAMLDDLRSRDPVTGEPPRPPGIQPLAQARLQQTPAARRQNEAALRYWEKQLRAIPPTMFPVRRAPDGLWYAEYLSPTMYRAAHAIAARLRVNTGPVLYAAMATALSHIVGVNPVATMITVNNRFRPGLADAAGHMVQHGLCTLDIDAAGFDELVRTARRRLMVAQKYGYYVQADVDALVERVGRERGVQFDLYCLYNDRRPEEGSPDASPAGPSTLTWRKVEHLHFRMIFHVNDNVDRALSLQVQFDTACIGRADVVALFEHMEKLLVAASSPGTER